MKEYIVLLFDEAQVLQDKEGFDNNAYLIEDEKGLKEFGSGAYFVNKEWYGRNMPRTKESYLQLIEDLVNDVDLSSPIKRLTASSFINIIKAHFLSKLENGTEPQKAFSETMAEMTEAMLKVFKIKKE